MDWKLAMQEERAAIMRIVALLFSLANLAERAAGRSWPVRVLVLWWLRRAQAAAFNFVAPPYDFAWVEQQPGSPAEAHLLAMCLRELARELERQTHFAFTVDGEAEPAEQLLFRIRLTRRAVHFVDTLRRFVLVERPQRALFATGPPV